MKQTIGLWSLLIGLVLAITSVFVNLGEWATQLLLILGILVGIFHDFKNDFVRLGVVYLSLLAAARSLESLFGVGPILTDIVFAWVQFLGPVVLTTMLLWGTPYLFNKKRA